MADDNQIRKYCEASASTLVPIVTFHSHNHNKKIGHDAIDDCISSVAAKAHPAPFDPLVSDNLRILMEMKPNLKHKLPKIQLGMEMTFE